MHGKEPQWGWRAIFGVQNVPMLRAGSKIRGADSRLSRLPLDTFVRPVVTSSALRCAIKWEKLPCIAARSRLTVLTDLMQDGARSLTFILDLTVLTMTSNPTFRTRHVAAPALLLCALLAACGGGGSSDSPVAAATPNSPAASQPTTPSTPSTPASSPTTADTQAPTITSSASVSADAVTLTAVASDNVGVSSVTFLVDGDSIQATVQKTPNDGTFTSSLPIGLITAGTHHLVAVAVDAAGNSTTSADSTFVIGNPNGNVDNLAPSVTAVAVEGNFGLVKLTAIARDETRLYGVDFLVDGQTAIQARPAYLGTDPKDQYYALFDTSTLAAGPHKVVARARDDGNHTTLSDEVVLNVEPSAGLRETEPNDDIGQANVVPSGVLQIAGNLKSTAITKTVLRADTDYYKLSVPAGKTLTVSMRSSQHQSFFVTIADAAGNKLSGDTVWTSSGVVAVSYANGAAAQDVLIRMTTIPYDFQTRDQYTLSIGLK